MCTVAPGMISKIKAIQNNGCSNNSDHGPNIRCGPSIDRDVDTRGLPHGRIQPAHNIRHDIHVLQRYIRL